MPWINQTEFEDLSKPLLGLPLVQTVNSFGSAIHLHLDSPDGVTWINIYWDWRLEDAMAVLCGSSDRRSEIRSTLDKLLGLTIAGFSYDHPLPDLNITLSNGWRLRSMSLVAGEPQWHITLPDRSTLAGRGGRLVHNPSLIPETYHPDPMADRIDRIATAANKRWPRHSGKPQERNCGDCEFFIRLDGPSAFLWFGACACGASSFDGKVVHQGFGCPNFSAAP